jgi:starch synthase
LTSKPPLNICLSSSELSPLAKSGGLADVCSALCVYLDGRGHDIRVLIPFYSSIDTSGLDIVPVDGLQNLSLSTGFQTFDYAIDSTTLPGSRLTVYLLRCDELYQRAQMYSGADEHLRFIFLSRAAIEMCQHTDFAPDIFHCHDWHTALVPLYLKTLYAWDSLFSKTRSVLTIHNIGYQGVFGADVLNDTGLPAYQEMFDRDDLLDDRINFMKTGVRHADFLTTVSPNYAKEILLPEFGMGLDGLLREREGDLEGILNGVDYAEWNPETDPLIAQPYSADKMAGKKQNKKALIDEFQLSSKVGAPIIGMVTRLTWQKGLELIQQVMPELLGQREFSLVMLGNGEAEYEDYFHWLQKEFPGRVGFYCGFNNQLAHQVEAGSDLFLMPSRYEPCGLNQMYSLRYGTVPIVRETGGLADSVQQYDYASGSGTGVLFRDFDAGGFNWAVNFALDLFQNKKDWKRVVSNGMSKDYSWDQQGHLYEELFHRLVKA